MPTEVIFPSGITDWTIDSADLILFADVSASNATKDCTVASLPVSTATQTALDAKVDENAAIVGATKTKITFDAKGLVTAGADATTADIAASADKNYVTDAQAVVIGNTSGTNTGNQTVTNSSDGTSHTVTLSASGGSVKLVEGSNITLTTTGTVADGVVTIASTAGGTWDVTWPGSSTDNAIARFDSTTGKILQNSSATVDDSGNASIAWLTTSGNIELGHASDTTISRVSAGKIAVEGVNVGNEGILQNSQSAAYTTVLWDAGKHIYHPSADTTARTWTIDSNANVPYPIGTALTFVNDTSGWVITIAITTDTLVLAWSGTTGSRTLAANGVATAIKVTSTRWVISWTGLT